MRLAGRIDGLEMLSKLLHKYLKKSKTPIRPDSALSCADFSANLAVCLHALARISFYGLCSCSESWKLHWWAATAAGRGQQLLLHIETCIYQK